MSDIWSGLVPPNIEQLTPYQPGKPVEELERELGIRNAVKIASNENPLGPSPRAVEAGREALAQCNRYPDGGCFHLRRALAERLGVADDELVFGAGSNEIIGMIVGTFCRPGVDEVLTHKYAFISYRLFAMAYGVPFVAVDATPQLGCDVDALIAAFSERTKVVFIANPNNPTGAYVNKAGFERILAALPPRALLVVDEAYHEYATALADDYPRSQAYRDQRPLLVTLRTFSKIYGLAGLRLGYAIAHRRVIDYLNRVRRPFNAASVAQAAALAALDDVPHVERSRALNRDGLEQLTAAARVAGVDPLPSLGNFVLVDVRRDCEPVYQRMLQRGVIVRPMAAWGLPKHLRISVGTAEENARTVAAMAEVIGGA
jgi:histidinol-phosphate aminotransferase